MYSRSAKGVEKGHPNRNPWLAKIVYPTLTVYLDCPLLITPSIFSNVNSSIYIFKNINMLSFLISKSLSMCFYREYLSLHLLLFFFLQNRPIKCFVLIFCSYFITFTYNIDIFNMILFRYIILVIYLQH